MSLEVRPLGAALGAQIAGVDLREDLGNERFETIHRAFVEHSVLVFRDQALEPDDQLAFSRRFGAPECHVLAQFSLPGHPDVFVVSNEVENGKPKGSIRAGQFWHSDCSYAENPTLASFLHAIDVPSRGGDTLFTSMSAAYDALSETMRTWLAGLRAVHDYTYAYETYFSKFPDRPPLTPEQIAKVPPVEHPVVRTHPESGRKALYVSPGFTRRIAGLNDDESDAVLGFLSEHVTKPGFVYRHAWRPGDLVMWDNRATLHCAMADYDMRERRHMHRTSVQGGRPY